MALRKRYTNTRSSDFFQMKVLIAAKVNESGMASPLQVSSRIGLSAGRACCKWQSQCVSVEQSIYAGLNNSVRKPMAGEAPLLCECTRTDWEAAKDFSQVGTISAGSPADDSLV